MGVSMLILKILYFLFMMGIILFLAYIVTRFVGMRQMNTLRGKNITVVESMSLGLDKVVYLIKIGNQCFLISSSGKNINFLSQVESSNVTINDEDGTPQQLIDMSGFKKYLEAFTKKSSKKETVRPQQVENSFYDVMKQQENVHTENMDKNVEKIRGLFSNIKTPDKGGEE